MSWCQTCQDMVSPTNPRNRNDLQAHDLWARLMTENLGYERFGAHGGDWGSTVTEQLARSHADEVVAIHLTDVPFGHLFQKPNNPSPAETKLFKQNEE